MTQTDLPATPPRPAGELKLTPPACRLFYLPSLHVTSGEINLELSKPTTTSLAKPLPGWVHASLVIRMQMSTLIIILSIVIQSATISHGIDYRIQPPGDPGSHILTYQTTEIETTTACSTKPPDSSYQPAKRCHTDRLVLQVPVIQVRPCQVTESLLMPHSTQYHLTNKHLAQITDILLLSITIHATSDYLSPMYRTIIWTLYLLNTRVIHATPTQSNKIQMYHCGGQYGQPQVQPFSLNTLDLCRNTSTVYLSPQATSIQVVHYTLSKSTTVLYRQQLQ